MKIALIDTGIDLNNKSLKVIGGVNFISGMKEGEYQDDNGHGTYCASIIQRVCPQAEFFVIKALNDQAEGSISMLKQALKYLKDTDIRVACLSLATREYDEELKQLCKELVQKDFILVSSVANGSAESYPAVFPGVIGVNSILMNNRESYWYDKEKIVQCVADITPVMVPELDGTYVMFGGNSKANAYISGKILNRLIKEPEVCLVDLEEHLQDEADKIFWRISDILEGRKCKYDSGTEKIVGPSKIKNDIYQILCEYFNITEFKIREILVQTPLNMILRQRGFYVILKKFEDRYGIMIDYLKIEFKKFQNIDILACYIQELFHLE